MQRVLERVLDGVGKLIQRVLGDRVLFVGLLGRRQSRRREKLSIFLSLIERRRRRG